MVCDCAQSFQKFCFSLLAVDIQCCSQVGNWNPWRNLQHAHAAGGPGCRKSETRSYPRGPAWCAYNGIWLSDALSDI